MPSTKLHALSSSSLVLSKVQKFRDTSFHFWILTSDLFEQITSNEFEYMASDLFEYMASDILIVKNESPTIKNDELR